MQIESRRKGEACELYLAGEMTIYHGLDIKKAFLQCLDEYAEIEVDLSQVSEVDSAGLQLLICAKKEADKRKKTLRIVSHSPAIVEAIDLCRIAKHFGDPLVISTH